VFSGEETIYSKLARASYILSQPDQWANDNPAWGVINRWTQSTKISYVHTINKIAKYVPRNITGTEGPETFDNTICTAINKAFPGNAYSKSTAEKIWSALAATQKLGIIQFKTDRVKLSAGVKCRDKGESGGTQSHIHYEGYSSMVDILLHTIPNNVRNGLVRLCTQYLLALRTDEALGIRKHHIDIHNRTLHIEHTKTARQGDNVHIPEDSVKFLEEHLQEFDNVTTNINYVKICHDVFGKGFSPYALRRGRATDMYTRMGQNFNEISKFLRNSPSIAKTHYVILSNVDRWYKPLNHVQSTTNIWKCNTNNNTNKRMRRNSM